MKIKIKRFDKTIPLPSYQTKGAACFDMYARVETIIESKSIGYIPLNVAVEIPEGYWAMLVARSSTHKTGLIPVNGLGVIDSDFCGDNDESHFAVYNFTDKLVTIERAQRIAQMMIMKYETAKFEEVTVMEHGDRGGFGSTGSN